MMVSVLPFLVAIPYFEFMLTADGLSWDYISAHPVAMVQSITEVQLLLPTTWITLFAQILPTLTILQALSDIKTLLQKEGEFVPRKPSAAAVAPITAPRTLSRSFTSFKFKKQPRFKKWIDVVFAVWGTVICILYLRSRADDVVADPATCQMTLRPWLSTRKTCGVVVVHCHHLQINGSARDIETVFDGMETDTVGWFIVAHCPELEMPPVVTRLSSLLGLDIYNSTLLSWGPEAAITDATTSSIFEVLLYKVNLDAVGNTLPPGLMADNVPSTLMVLTIGDSNLSALSTEFPEKWDHHMFVLVMDRCHISSLPAGMGEMDVSNTYSLRENDRLTSIPDVLFDGPAYLILDGDDALKLPSNVTAAMGVSRTLGISLRDTHLAMIPQWVIDNQVQFIDLENTPVCADQTQSFRMIGQTNVACTMAIIPFRFDKWAADRAELSWADAGQES